MMDHTQRRRYFNTEYRMSEQEADRWRRPDPLPYHHQSPQRKAKPSQKTEGKYRSFPVYLRIIFGKSLITSFPEIAASKSWIKKIIKIVVFVITVVGFVYQTLDFLNMYFAYPTVVNVEVSNPYEVKQPALTICNRNRYRRSAFCSTLPKQCTFYKEELFCKMFTRSCPDDFDPFLGMPFMYIYVVTQPIWETAINYSHTDKVIKSCTKNVEGTKIPCKTPFLKVPTVTTDGETNFCYTIESQWSEPDSKSEMYPNTFDFSLLLDTEPEEYTIPTEPVKLQLAMHDRRKVVNAYAEGYLLTGGLVYDAFVTMTEKEMLPPPYDTNCTDYEKLWNDNGGEGPLNEIMCVELCKLNTLKENGSCIDKNVVYSHTEPLCKIDIVTVTSDIIHKCNLECGKSCHDSSYEMRLEAVNNYDSVCNSDNCKIKWIKINIYFNRFRVTKFKYQAKFASVEVFSYVGGYMGMWLGVSLVSLFDLLETFCYILYYPVGKMKKMGKMKKRRGRSNGTTAPHEKLFTVREY